MAGFGPKVSEVTKTTTVVSGYLIFAGFISYYFKERLYVPDPVPATIVGVLFGPLCANLINPLAWFSGDQETLISFTLQLSRFVVGIQVFFNGANLPKRYIRTEWLSLFIILFPVMIAGWLLVGLCIWGLIPGLSFVEALVISGCIVPTDPVLANSICKGTFAETFVPLNVRALIIGESGANDGLALPYLMLPLFLIRRSDPSNEWSSLGAAIGHWIYEVVIYQACMGAAMGIIIGYCSRKMLRFAHDRHLVDHESFLAWNIATALFVLGFVHISGASDIIGSFLAGCMFNWDGWFQEESAGQAFSEIIDMYFATASHPTFIFLYIGAVLPFDYWNSSANVIDGWRLVVLGILVLTIRRIPFLIPLTKLMPALDGWKEVAFVGYFGPIGVGTLYWTAEATEYIEGMPGRENLRNALLPINYFIILFSVLVHGTSIAMFQGTRTVFGKGHPEVKDEEPIPIRPGADLYIAPSHLQSRNDLALSRTSTRRQSAREYLSRQITIPSQGPSRPAAYRSQLDLALERSNTRRTSAKDYLDRTRTISPDSYDAAQQRGEDSQSIAEAAAMSPHRSRDGGRTSSASLDARRSATSLAPTTSERSNNQQQQRGNSGASGTASNNRASRLDWIRRGRMARGEPVSDDNDDEEPDEDDNASNRKTTTVDGSGRV